MLREKPVKKEILERYRLFIEAVRWTEKQTNILTLSQLANRYGINSSAPGTLIQLGFIKKENSKLWEWLKPEKSSEQCGLEMLNHLLNKTKKTIHVPIPDFAAIGESLKTIAERLAHIAVQNERLLKSDKTGVKSGDADLFRVDDQRLFIGGQIASGVYRNAHLCNHRMIDVPVFDNVNSSTEARKAQCEKCGFTPNGTEELYDYTAYNRYIVLATDDLLSQFKGK